MFEMTQQIQKITIAFLLFILITSFKSDKEKYPPRDTFPTPSGIENMLFYIQRAKDHNTIIYQLNIDENGDLNEENPINPYWIKYTDEKKETPLTMIQQKFAYGLKIKLVDKENKIYQFNFVSYKKESFYLKKDKKDNKYHVYGKINEKLAELDNIFINIQGGTFWFPKIEYVAINATCVKSNKALVEKITP